MCCDHRSYIVTVLLLVVFRLSDILPLASAFSSAPYTSGGWQWNNPTSSIAPSGCGGSKNLHSIRRLALTRKKYNTLTLPSTKSANDVDEGDDLDMPWSEVQDWALRDNLAKFTAVLPASATGGKPKKYAMWRALTREVPELAGYPIPFLLKMHQRALENDAAKSNSTSSDDDAPGVLPMVDDFEFASNGGIVGRAYGLLGVADGTRIQTPPLIAVERTIPLGYVTTEEIGGDRDGKKAGFSYELGTCALSSAYSLDGSERSAALLSARRLVAEGVVGSSTQLVSTAKDLAVTGSGLLTDAEANSDLIYLGGVTAMLLASATAVGMLSHHLTVNVFWV
mmetsp:Transcript_1143/g.2019  ORF Transcript_1143/g.2019 Transcript_1143/m.2019 type:complete len:338 (+) Transcript_1143:133-1146(+)